MKQKVERPGGAVMAGTSETDAGDRPDDTTVPAGPGVVEPGGENASVRAAVVTGTLLALAALLVLYLLVQVWPPAPPPALSGGGAPTPTTTTPAGQVPATTVVVQAAPNPPVRLFGARLEVDREVRLFLVVALAGALGGLVYALRSLTWYAGNRNLKYSWMMTYYLQPIVGAGLATITYVVLRGGLVVVTTQASPDVVNPFGFAAFGALVGLFSAQAAEWLKRVFEQVFTPAPTGKDPAIVVRITDVQPAQAPVGTEVVITGTGLADVQRVTFGGVEAPSLRKVSATELRVTVPDGAADGLITIHTPAGTADSPRPFTVGELATQPPAEARTEEPAAGEEEQPSELDPEEQLEAGLTGSSPGQVTDLDQQASAEHGEPQDAEIEDEPLDEDALLPDDAEEGKQP
jgi:IPT/TIG domain